MSLWKKASAKHQNRNNTCHWNLLKRLVIDFLPALHDVLLRTPGKINQLMTDEALSYPANQNEFSNVSMRSSRLVYNVPRCV